MAAYHKPGVGSWSGKMTLPSDCMGQGGCRGAGPLIRHRPESCLPPTLVSDDVEEGAP